MKGLQSGWKARSNWGVLPYNHPASPEHENSKNLKRNTQSQRSIWYTSLIIIHCDGIQTALRTQEVGPPKTCVYKKMNNLKITLKILAEITQIPCKCHASHLPWKCTPETFQSSKTTNTHHPCFKAARHRFTSSERDQALKLYLQLQIVDGSWLD